MVKTPPDLKVNIGGIKLKNPILLASGTCGYGLELTPFLDLNKIGGVVVKGLSLKPKMGNPPPRTCETPSGLLNAIGLENVGVRTFLEDKLPRLKDYDTCIIANFFGNTIAEYVEAAEILSAASGLTALEMNISCPNVKEGGIVFGTNPDLTRQLVQEVVKVCRLPLIVKLSPNVSDIGLMARIVEDAGAQAISLINTLLGLVIDIKTRRPKLGNITGGLSGPAIRPVAVRMVWEAYKAVKIPILGIGGIMNYQDVLEFMIAGAGAVQIGTANLVNPDTAEKILADLEVYLKDNSIKKIEELKGSLVLR